MKTILVSFVLILFSFYNLYAKTIFIYNNNDDKVKTNLYKKVSYNYQLLKLALDKTIPKYGEYELLPSKKMNKRRAIHTVKTGKIKNFILEAAATKELLQSDLIYSSFPVYRGIQGYRIAFISPKIKDDKSKYNTLGKIKSLKIGQGEGWLDTDILRYNHFNVKGFTNAKGLTSMVSVGRIDLFLRGINEIKDELKEYSYIKNLDYDKTFMIYYHLPKFFFTNKADKEAIKRIDEGLKMAFKDGSLNKLFNRFFKKNIDFIDVSNRKIYKIENPYLENIDTSYEKYVIEFLGDQS